MSRRRKYRKKKSRKKLAYGLIAVTFILLCFVTYFSLRQSNQTSNGNATPPKAAIVDHLSRREPNQTFVQTSTTILKGGFSVDYYDWIEITVDFYKDLLKHGYSLIILRVHSAVMEGATIGILGLFTWEDYDPDNVPAKYFQDVMDDRLVEAYFTEEERALGERYFGIVPKFVEKYGNFQNTVIIMMGCEGLKYNVMAEAFRKRGAKVCIGWDGLVSNSHTDHATICLLQRLAQGDTIEKAVDKTMSEVGPEKLYFKIQGYNSSLKYYPAAAGSYTIQYTIGISSMNIIRTNTVFGEKKEKN